MSTDPLKIFWNSCRRQEGKSDDHLNGYFVNTDVVEDILSSSSLFVVLKGLKGSGKSALYRKLTEFEIHSGVLVHRNGDDDDLEIDASGLNANVLRKLLIQDLLNEIFNALDETTRNVSSKDLNEAKSYVNNYLGRATQWAKDRIAGGGFLGISIRLHQAKNSRLKLSKARIKKGLDLLQQMTSKGLEVDLVYDDPEQFLTSSDSPPPNLLGGLVMALQSICERCENVGAYVLLKATVWDQIWAEVEDVHNFPEGCVQPIVWKRTELTSVLTERLHWSGMSWDEAFQVGEDRAKQFLDDFVFPRLRTGPRQLLKWTELAVGRTFASKRKKIALTDFQETISSFSNQALIELGATYSGIHNGISDFVRDVFRGQSEPMYKEDLERLVETKSPAAANNYAKEVWYLSRTPMGRIDLLFQTGCLALHFPNRVILPYELEYSHPRFRDASAIQLVPTFQPVLQGK